MKSDAKKETEVKIAFLEFTSKFLNVRITDIKYTKRIEILIKNLSFSFYQKGRSLLAMLFPILDLISSINLLHILTLTVAIFLFTATFNYFNNLTSFRK